MNQTAKWIIGAIVVAAVITIGYSTPKSPSEQTSTVSAGTIKIGFIAPLTGDGAVYGEPGRNITALAVEEINKAGGINGRQIEMIYEDGKCNGKDAANAAQKLVNVDEVKIIIGGFCSSESLASLPIAEKNKVVLFSPGSSSPDLTGRSLYFFRDYPSDAAQGRILAEAVYNKKGWKNVVVMQEQTDYALGVYKTFSANFEKLGGSKVVKEEFPSNATDFRSMLVKLKALKPDALFIATQTPAVGERIMKQLKDLKWNPALLIDDAIAGDPKTIENNEAILEGALTAEFGVDLANPKFKHAMQAYKDKYGAEPPFQSYAQTEYDAVYIIRDAIAAVGYDGEKIANWSRTIKDWDGASGKVTIGQDGDRVSGHRLEIVKNGKVEVYQ